MLAFSYRGRPPIKYEILDTEIMAAKITVFGGFLDYFTFKRYRRTNFNHWWNDCGNIPL
jgi:hypothetical protein